MHFNSCYIVSELQPVTPNADESPKFYAQSNTDSKHNAPQS